MISPESIKNSLCKRLNTLFLVSALMLPSAAAAISLDKEPQLRAIADGLKKEHGFSERELQETFAEAEFLDSVLQAMKNPAEYKFTWGKYRKLFLQPDRIQQGVEFWKQYADELSRAEKEYGVPASIIVAIIGVESKFGRYKGQHRVLDSLVTLVTGYPRRSKFFAGELREFLILARENGLATNEVLGSYAGAMGYPQFISSSYRNYAVDFTGDGIIDLIDQPVDAIGSIANYFVENGWRSGEPVTSSPVAAVPAVIADKANRKRKVRFTASELREAGAVLDGDIDDSEKLNVLKLDTRESLPESESSQFYIVRAGDTACQIAERFNMRCAELFRLNSLDKKGRIYRDQRLRVAAGKPQASAPSSGKWSVGSGDSQQPSSQRFFFTHENFYVITRYNQSVLYAMAVHDLSQALQQAKHEAQ